MLPVEAAKVETVTIQTAKSQHLYFCTLNLLLPAACVGHLFDCLQVEKCKWKEEMLEIVDGKTYVSFNVI